MIFSFGLGSCMPIQPWHSCC